jgi:hypothetical protein
MKKLQGVGGNLVSGSADVDRGMAGRRRRMRASTTRERQKSMRPMKTAMESAAMTT